MEKRKGIRLTETQRLHWLRLFRSENVGAVTFMELIRHYGSAEQALLALPNLIKNSHYSKKIRIANETTAQKEIEYAQRLGVKIVCIGEPDYPPFLRATDHPPPIVTIRGNCAIFEKKSIGIVGSRNASASGKKITEIFAKNLGDMGFAIISGLARGIDSTAHQASIKTGTIAVVAGGVDTIYPHENEQLYYDIIKNGGAIISEMPLSWQPRANDFPRRNRIIASLSLGLLVVEAAKRSGSLITARLAADIGRTVFAIPGSPLDPRASGTNGLIREGATLVTTAKELSEAISPIMAPNLATSTTTAEQNQQLSFFEAENQSLDLDDLQPMDATLDENIDHDLRIPPLANSKDKKAPRQSDIPYDDRDFSFDDGETEAVLAALSPTPIDIETLCFHSGVSIQRIYLILIELDLAGKLIRHAGGYVSLHINDFHDLH